MHISSYNRVSSNFIDLIYSKIVLNDIRCCYHNDVEYIKCVPVTGRQPFKDICGLSETCAESSFVLQNTAMNSAEIKTKYPKNFFAEKNNQKILGNRSQKVKKGSENYHLFNNCVFVLKVAATI